MRIITEEQKSLLELFNKNDPSSPRPEDEAVKLNGLINTALRCSKCSLRSGCSQVVFGEGNPQARLMLVGEAPGSDEDRVGRPFVGRAGQLLDRILEAANIERKEIYITNVVKCRPPANRMPSQAEVESCRPYLTEQLELVKPKIVVCLGALATRNLIDRNTSITRVRGQWHQKGSHHLIATFHPAALLRDPGKKKPVWEDFKQVMRYYHDHRGG